MIKKTIRIDEDYLHIPVKSESGRNELQIWAGKVLLYSFTVSLDDDGPYEYFFINMKDFKGCKVDILLPSPQNTGEKSLENIFCAGAPETRDEYTDLYHEKLRPQFHFSSRRGWLNDPNGLYWYDGLYHLYYQHDPLGVLHQSVNISWGHAVSEDLISWKEKDDALMPWRRDWFIASGSAMIDKNGVAGFGENAVIAAFTCLGARLEDATISPSGGQFIAISEDSGDTFRRFSDMPAIPVPNGADWRDPRLFEDDGTFYIAVYERREDVNGVAFYSSLDMKNWEFKSWIPDLFECPDLFKLPVNGTDKAKWILYGADGLVRLGDFEKGVFTCDGISFPLDYGYSTYAGQTWSHEPKGRRVHISWIRGMGGQTEWEENMGYQEMPFSQCMSIPCEINLHYIKGQYHLCRYPVKETDSLRIEPVRESSFLLDGEKRIPLHASSDLIFRIDSQDKAFEIKIGPCLMRMDFLENTVEIDEKGIRKLRHEETELRILTDRTCIEIFVNQEVSATYSLDTKDINICFSGKADIYQHEWDMRPFWRKSNSK